MQSVPDSSLRQDGWKSAIFAELQRLNGQQHERKKKDTIIALVDVTLAGVSALNHARAGPRYHSRRRFEQRNARKTIAVRTYTPAQNSRRPPHRSHRQTVPRIQLVQ